MIRRDIARFFIFTPVIIFIGAFIIYPVLMLFFRSFSGEFSTSNNVIDLLRNNNYIWSVVWFTLWQAFLSTILTLIIGIPGAYLFAKYNFWGKSLFRSLVSLPFVMPTVVIAIGFISLFSTNGLVDRVFSMIGLDGFQVNGVNGLVFILLAHIMFNYSIVIRIVSVVWENIDERLLEVASILGANWMDIFSRIILPILYPAILSAAILVFMFSFTSFGVVLMLGGYEYSTLEVLIYQLTTKMFRLETAAIIAIVQILIIYIFLYINSVLQQKFIRDNGLSYRRIVKKEKLVNSKSFIVLFSIVILVFVMLLPLVALVDRIIFISGNYLESFINLFKFREHSYFFISPWLAIFNSLKFALISSFISVLIGGIASYYLSSKKKQNRINLIDAFLMLPLGIPAVVLGLGFLLAYSYYPIDLRGSWVVIVLAHSIIGYPFVIRSILPMINNIPSNLYDSANVLGGSTIYIFRTITIPLIWRGVLVGTIFAFAVSIGEFGSSLILYRKDLVTIPVAIYRYLGQPGDANLSAGLAMSLILVSVVLISFILIEKIRFRGVGSFY